LVESRLPSAPGGAPVLALDNLKVSFTTHDAIVEAVRGVSLQIQAGECLGVVGESGSGKSQAFMTAMGLLAPQRPGERVRALSRD